MTLSRRTRGFFGAVALGIVMLLSAPPRAAWADSLDDLARTLRKDPDDKVRLSAAVGLGKLKDRRAIPAFTDALSDSAWRIRYIAAKALGQLVDGSADVEARNRAIDGLERVARDDADANVREQALKAFNLVSVYRVTKTTATAGGVFVDLSSVVDGTGGTGGGAGLTSAMRNTAESAFTAVSYVTRWSGKKLPSQADLTKARAAAFFVDLRLEQVSVAKDGGVTCAASGQLGLYPRDKKLEVIATWRAARTTAYASLGRRKKDIAEARILCVTNLTGSMASDAIKKINERVSAKSTSAQK